MAAMPASCTGTSQPASSVKRVLIARTEDNSLAMAQDRVETLRGIYAEWAEGKMRAGLELFDQHVVYVVGREFMESGVYYGMRALQGFLRDFLAAWKDYTLQGTEFIEAGDTVVAAVSQRAEGVSSGAATDLSYFQLWTFRADRVIRLENVMHRDDALEAAGLPADATGF
jgi:ketosteroid isomerase-like protein